MRKPTFLILSALVASSAVSSAGLVAHYKFDETTGQVASDSAGTPQDLTTSNGGVAWTSSGRIGGAVDLTQDVMYGQDAIGDGNAFTISMWVNEASGQGGYRGVYTTGAGFVDDTSGNPTIPGGGTDNWGINLEGSRQGDLRVNNVPSGSSFGMDTPGATQGSWNLLTLTYSGDGSSAISKSYLNGAPVGTATNATFTNMELSYSAGGQLWQLGTDRNDDGRRYTGLVDDLAIWDEALSDAQILAIYDGGLLGIDAATVIPESSSAILAFLGGLLAFRRRR